MRIGLMGIAINNKNMGCIALTMSLLELLKSIADDNSICIDYTLFDERPEKNKTNEICNIMNIDISHIRLVKEGRYGSVKRIAWHFIDNIKQINEIRKCDLIIDLTQGDSFTDIYGERRFYNYTRMKRLVQKLHKPLILGPQTYGPFEIEKCARYAKKVINDSKAVITRDCESGKYLEKLGIRKFEVTTDLAFALPFELRKIYSKKIRIGVNISGLLVAHKIESTETKFQRRVNYDELMLSVIDWIYADKRYELHIIPHVEEDLLAAEELLKNYPDVIFHKMFKNPIEAKECITSMDIFVGARMHAAIAALSGGVATIPLAYSRKFTGLFSTLGYEYTIDLQKTSTKEAINTVIDYIQKIDILKKKVDECKSLICMKNEMNRLLIEKIVLNYCNDDV